MIHFRNCFAKKILRKQNRTLEGFLFLQFMGTNRGRKRPRRSHENKQITATRRGTPETVGGGTRRGRGRQLAFLFFYPSLRPFPDNNKTSNAEEAPFSAIVGHSPIISDRCRTDQACPCSCTIDPHNSSAKAAANMGECASDCVYLKGEQRGREKRTPCCDLVSQSALQASLPSIISSPVFIAAAERAKNSS